MIDTPLIPVEFASPLCAEIDPELFYPEKGGSNRDAKKICGRCIHIDDCLEGALAREERFGIYGGKSERERARILRDRKRAAA